ncbi:MAG TPA: Hsp20/alpha crystallin family protein [Lacisediminihabitans sp.]|uniref:Hsp20/alpha crystallin family protein n=1 Tax=Lacisediminihabitans sp. TaxID=2787631 RepID=UPI002EDB986A
MLIRNDPFRELDRFAQQVFGTATRPSSMPMDAWREGDEFVVQLDLPGVDQDKIDIDVERNVLTVKAERFANLPDASEAVTAERPWGVFSRQLVLGDTLDTENVKAHYDAGVLTLRVPIAANAKPRKIEISSGTRHAGKEQQKIDA